MPITIRNNLFKNCGTAVSTTPDVDLEMDGNSIIDCTNGVVVRDPAQVAQYFSVSEELVRDVMARLAPYQHAERSEQEAAVRGSPFWDAVGKAADLATVVPLLLALL